MRAIETQLWIAQSIDDCSKIGLSPGEWESPIFLQVSQLEERFEYEGRHWVR